MAKTKTKPKPKPKTTKPAKSAPKQPSAPAPAKWIGMPFGWGIAALALGPAETMVRWRGRGGDKVRITFQYWQTIRDQLPEDVRPTKGHPDTPHLVVGSDAEAKAVVEKLRQFLAARHPGVTVKRQANINLTRFLAEGVDYRLVIAPESDGDAASEEIGEAAAMRWPLGDAEVLIWSLGARSIWVRATADEIVFSAGQQAPTEISGPATSHGTWTFDATLVATWVAVALADLKEFAGATPKPKALAAFHGKVLKAKKSEDGGAVILAASGRYRAETGGEMARWLRLVRA